MCRAFCSNKHLTVKSWQNIDLWHLLQQVGPRCEVPDWKAFYRCLVAASTADRPRADGRAQHPGLLSLSGWQRLWRPPQACTPP